MGVGGRGVDDRVGFRDGGVDGEVGVGGRGVDDRVGFRGGGVKVGFGGGVVLVLSVALEMAGRVKLGFSSSLVGAWLGGWVGRYLECHPLNCPHWQNTTVSISMCRFALKLFVCIISMPWLVIVFSQYT